jgi:hypothetical protein
VKRRAYLRYGSLLRKEVAMEKKTDATQYEAPRIADHGDLTELTAAGSVGTEFDSEFTAKKGESTAGHLQTSP